ncbi:MAG: hypothetical protein Q4G34_10925, partial [Micrococcus sp.]|nr:hypothetical protein [Micrococcus sp.]
TAASLALLRGDPDLVTGAVLGGLMYTAGMAVLFVLSRGGLGLGDVKLAAGLGIYTGMFGVGTTAMAAVAAILIGGLISLALVVLGRARGSTPIPFGPAMVAGAIAALGIAVLNSGVQ